MSKMRTPEMEVVRFKEADVIVASGYSSMSVSGFQNKTPNDASFNVSGVASYTNDGTQDISAFYSALSTHYEATINGSTTLDRGDVAASFTTLFERDASGTSRDFDGTYSWTGTGFKRQ